MVFQAHQDKGALLLGHGVGGMSPFLTLQGKGLRPVLQCDDRDPARVSASRPGELVATQRSPWDLRPQLQQALEVLALFRPKADVHLRTELFMPC